MVHHVPATHVMAVVAKQVIPKTAWELALKMLSIPIG
jgi:hypothetical protein